MLIKIATGFEKVHKSHASKIIQWFNPIITNHKSLMPNHQQTNKKLVPQANFVDFMRQSKLLSIQRLTKRENGSFVLYRDNLKTRRRRSKHAFHDDNSHFMNFLYVQILCVFRLKRDSAEIVSV